LQCPRRAAEDAAPQRDARILQLPQVHRRHVIDVLPAHTVVVALSSRAGPPRHACRDGTVRSGAYFRCLLTSFVISNMLTVALPPNTVLSDASALIIRLFLASCSLFFLM